MQMHNIAKVDVDRVCYLMSQKCRFVLLLYLNLTCIGGLIHSF